jgi:hypothetical protein
LDGGRFLISSFEIPKTNGSNQLISENTGSKRITFDEESDQVIDHRHIKTVRIIIQSLKDNDKNSDTHKNVMRFGRPLSSNDPVSPLRSIDWWERIWQWQFDCMELLRAKSIRRRLREKGLVDCFVFEGITYSTERSREKWQEQCIRTDPVNSDFSVILGFLSNAFLSIPGDHSHTERE